MLVQMALNLFRRFASRCPKCKINSVRDGVCTECGWPYC